MLVITIEDIIGFIMLGLFILGAIGIWILSKIEKFKARKKKQKEVKQ